MTKDTLRNEIEKILYSVHPKHKSGNCLRFKGATAQLEALIQEYVEGIVPPEKPVIKDTHTTPEYKLQAISYNQCRQDILDRLKQ